LVNIDRVFSVIHPYLVRKEEEQNGLKNQVQPLLQKRSALLQENGSTKDIDEELAAFDEVLQKFQESVEEFEWDESVVNIISSIVQEVYQTH
jgi:hypothetical protein